MERYHEGASKNPAWSPDGSQIVFSGSLICPDNTGTDLWVMDANGANKINITYDNGTADIQPAFSPDGKRIVFVRSKNSEPTQLFTISKDGGTAPRPIKASLTSGFAQRVGSTPLEGVALVGIENLEGSRLADTLVGSALANALVGRGADSLLDLGGPDALNSRDGVSGNDRVDGGSGPDLCTTDEREEVVRGCE